jgi:DNA-binding HxlR family transcriptional regulator
MKKARSEPVVSNIDVLETISDQLSMDIITAISNHVTNSDNLMQILDITHKQYHSRSSRLSNLGLISRNDGEIVLTSFGQLVYKAQLKIATAFSHSSELKTIDAIQSHSGMSDEEQKKIIDKLLDDSELKNLIV